MIFLQFIFLFKFLKFYLFFPRFRQLQAAQQSRSPTESHLGNGHLHTGHGQHCHTASQWDGAQSEVLHWVAHRAGQNGTVKNGGKNTENF